jgi:predicted Zn-dependent protease with MMP-like domain
MERAFLRVTIMDGDPFDEALDAAMADLPEPYRRELDSVAVVVQDEPDAEQLASVGAHGLFGLYQGVPRTAYGADGAPVASKITLFRGPLMRAYPTRDALMRGVRETLDHEVAHHLGISDARLRELKATTSS